MRNPKNMLIVGIVLLVVGVGILLFNPGSKRRQSGNCQKCEKCAGSCRRYFRQ